MKIAVFGLGYVGSVTAACLASEGHEVWGVDVDGRKAESIEKGTSSVAEPGLAKLIGDLRAEGRLRATSHARDGMDGADVSLVSVGTPSLSNGSLDLGAIRSVAEDIGANLSVAAPGHHVIIRSTVLPGTTHGTVIPLIESSSDGRQLGVDFEVSYWPEFLRESTAIADFRDPPFVVVGSRSAGMSSSLSSVVEAGDAEVIETSIPVAESVKYASNAFHAVKVAFGNEIARLLSGTDADPREVMAIFTRDSQLNISPAYLRPGFAFGGSCLPKDLRALTYFGKANDIEVPLLSSVIESNVQHARLAASRVLQSGARRVALLGLAFKSQTDDLRESPAVELAETLLGKGIELAIYDDHVNPDALFGANRAFMEDHLPHLHRLLVESPEAALRGADGAVVVSASDAALSVLGAFDPPFVLDVNGRLPQAVRELGGYRGLAW